MPHTFYTPVSWLEGPVKVQIIGAGGTGSEVVDALARLHHALIQLGHPGGLHVTLWDGDEVSQTNTLRQRFWPTDVGQNKAQTLIQRLNLFSGLNWTAIPHHFELYSEDEIACDLLITCVDKASFRYDLGDMAYGQHADVLWLDTGNGSREGQVILGDLGDPEYPSEDFYRLPNVFDLYGEQLRATDDDDAPSCSAAEALAAQDALVNRFVATIASELIWDLLRHGKIERHGAFLDLDRLSVSPLPIDPKQWAIFGYDTPKAA